MHVEYQISLICFKFDIFMEKVFTFFSNFDFVEKVWNWKGEYGIFLIFNSNSKIDLNGVKLNLPSTSVKWEGL